MEHNNLPILFFGGTFNPPHLGHFNLVSYVGQIMNFSKIYIVPSFVPPHKQDPDMALFEDRIKMTQILFAKKPSQIPCEVSDIEQNLPAPSYTFQTLRSLKEKHPDSEIYPLVGMDMYINLEQWKNYEELRKNFHFIVLQRKDLQCFSITSGDKVLDNPFWDIASNEIRDLIARFYQTRDDASREEIEKLISPEVFHYILSHRLYEV